MKGHHRHPRFAVLAALLLTLSLIFLLPTAALAAGTPGEQASPPTVVGELPSLTTMTSDTYLLSDGSRQAVIYSQPIRFRDAAGAWQSFDTSLLPSTTPGAYKAARTPVALTIGALADGGQGAQLAADGYTVTLTLLDAGGLTLLGKPVALPVSGATAGYLGIAPDTDIAYTALNWGVEQTLTLNSATAPNTFRARLSHPGLVLARDDLGQWGLYVPGAPYPLFFISDISVVDSSGQTGAMPAICYGAAMTVKAGKDQSTLTYTVPKAWLSDPARIFPVIIDPTLTKNPDPGNAGYPDTCVSSQGSGSHGPAPNLLTGKHTDGYYWRSLLKFDTTSVPNGAYIGSATLSVRKYDQGASTPNAYLRPMWTNWSGGNTWNDLNFSVNSYPVGWTDYQGATAPAWLNFDARSIVQGWKDGSITNYGFEINQKEDGSQGSAYASWYRSADYSDSSYWPKLVVNYDPTPSAAPTTDRSVYGFGETATINVKAATYYKNDVTFIECGLNLAKSDGSPFRGVVGWFKTPSLVPSSSWHQVATMSGGSVFAYYQDPAYPSDYGADTITLQPSACNIGSEAGSPSAPGYQRAGFVITLGSSFGGQLGVTPDTRFGMGPASGTTTTWVSGGPLGGGLSHPPASTGWRVQPGAAFSVINTNVSALTYSALPSAWFDATSGPDDSPDQGRGSATLMWPTFAGASGYHIYANDGSGTYRQIGATLSGGAILWSSAGSAFYPKDSEIAALGAPFTGNPLYRAATPAAGTLQSTLTPSPAPDPVGSPGSGVLLSDGTYIYEHRWGAYGGPSKWTRIGTGSNGTTLGYNYGPIPNSPDISTIGGNSATAFLLSGYLYNGATTAASASSATVVGVSTADGSTTNFTFTGNSPLDRATGASITANNNSLLLAAASDAEGTHIYSVAYTLSTDQGGPRYDGYRVREYDQSGAFVADHTLGMTTGSSEYIDGVLADGAFLYLITWHGDSSAHITKISTATWQVTNQWAIDQATTRVVGGCYDAVNNCVWLGALDANHIYKYAGSGGTTNPGYDLRDNPGPLYAKTANGAPGAIASWTAYDFKVVPYTNANGVSTETTPPNPAAYRVAATLDNRTLQQYRDSQHSETGLGSWDGHDVTARLDAGSLRVGTTDLAISTWGPAAAVSRTYDSTNATAGLFAPGWRFAFERALNLGTPTTSIAYTDEAGDVHTFTSTDGGTTWLTPNGYFGTLAKNGSAWKITNTDQSVLNFNSTGQLTSEVDRNANATSYTYTSGKLTAIAAANGQQISLTYSGAKLSSVSYTVTISGQQVTREVNYATASPWQVTYFPSKPEARVVSYAYNAASRLSAITQLGWPQAGQNVSESFAYDGSARLTEVDYPDYNVSSKPDARATIDYSVANQATVYRYGRVGDTANTLVVSQRDIWDPTTKLLDSQTLAKGGSENTTTTYDYAANLQLAHTVCLAADANNVTTQSISATDAKGNITNLSQDGVGATSFTYDSRGNVLTETKPPATLGAAAAVVTNTYDGSSNLATSSETLNSTDNAYVDFAHDSQGRVTRLRQLISGAPNNNPVWAITDYADFAPNGEAQTIIKRGVVLSDGGTPTDFTSHMTYDAFGNLISKTDPGGARVIETNTSDLAGRLVTDADAMGATTHRVYDRLGNCIETWVSSSVTGVKADWEVDTYDAVGNCLTTTTRLSDSSGNPTTSSVVTNVYDGLENKITSDDSTLGGASGKWIYDSRGNPLKQWDEGVVDYTDVRGTRASYDAANMPLSTYVPGNSAATVDSYKSGSLLAQETYPDHSYLKFTYDGLGRTLTETTPCSTSASATWTYDTAGRVSSQTCLDGAATTYGTDDLGRITSATTGAQVAKSAYNSLGWLLRATEATNSATIFGYDGAGRLTSSTRGTVNPGTGVFTASESPTTYSYDDDDRLLSQTDPNGRILAYTYDPFGNLIEEKHTVGGVVTKDITTAVDSLGRPTSRSDSVSGETHTWTYPVNVAAGVAESVTCSSGASATTAISRDARNQETQRSTNIGTGTNVPRTVNNRDSAERVTQATLATSNVQHWVFDAADGYLTRQWGSGFTAAAQNTDAYSYDNSTGQKTGDNIQLAYGGTISGSYTYDGEGRLSSATLNGTTETDSFDTAGNLSQAVVGSTTNVFHYDSANRLTQKDVNGLANTYYSWNTTYGRRTSQGPTQGNQPITYGYTAAGQLAGYGDTTRGISATYSYDASGHRSQSTVVSGSTTTTTGYIYEGDRLEQLTATCSDSTSWRISYLYDENGSPYAGVYRSPSTSTSPVVFGVVTNDRGDILELLDTASPTPAPFAAYRYDVWGNPTSSPTQSTGIINATLAAQIASRQVLRYAGYIYDAESGLYYCSSRSYDPVTRQFLSPDPGGLAIDSPYQYCDQSPVEQMDQDGQAATTTIWKAWPLNAVTAFKKRVRAIAVKWTDAVVPYKYTGPTGQYEDTDGDGVNEPVVTSPRHPEWGVDCSGFVQMVLNRAKAVITVVAPHNPGRTHKITYRLPIGTPWDNATRKNDFGLYSLAGRKGIPNVNFFDKNKKLGYHIGDILDEPGEHIILVISDGKDPETAESTQWSGGPDYNFDWHKDGTHRWSLSHRWNSGTWHPTVSGRYFHVKSN